MARELLRRKMPLAPGGWLFFLVTCVCLAISAFYELIEWWTALASGTAATDFLGTQGDPWDTQWDMFLAFVGAVAAQVLLSRAQERQLARSAPRPSRAAPDGTRDALLRKDQDRRRRRAVPGRGDRGRRSR